MLEWLFGKKEVPQAKEEVSTSNYATEEHFLLEHISQNLEQLLNELLTTSLRYAKDIKYENARMQLVALSFIEEKMKVTQNTMHLVGHDIKHLEMLAHAVKNLLFHDDQLKLNQIGLQHAIERHCQEIGNLQEESHLLLNKVQQLCAKWKKNKLVTKTEQSDVKSDFLRIHDEVNYALENVRVILDYSKRLQQYVATYGKHNNDTYVFHALHIFTKEELGRLLDVRLKQSNLHAYALFVKGTRIRLSYMDAIIRKQVTNNEHQMVMLHGLDQINSLLSSLAQLIEQGKQKLTHKDKTLLKTHLLTLQDLYADFDNKVKLLNG